MTAISRFFIRAWYTLIVTLAPYTFRLTQWFGRKRGPEVAVHPDFESIARSLRWGTAYKADPLGGVLDVMRHPRAIQGRIDRDDWAGDCEDHAAYIIACATKARLAGKLYAGAIYGRRDGKFIGHVVCVFRERGQWFWMDYGMPRAIDGQWGWVEDCARQMGLSKTTAAFLLESSGISKDEAVKFRKRGKVWLPPKSE